MSFCFCFNKSLKPLNIQIVDGLGREYNEVQNERDELEEVGQLEFRFFFSCLNYESQRCISLESIIAQLAEARGKDSAVERAKVRIILPSDMILTPRKLNVTNETLRKVTLYYLSCRDVIERANNFFFKQVSRCRRRSTKLTPGPMKRCTELEEDVEDSEESLADLQWDHAVLQRVGSISLPEPQLTALKEHFQLKLDVKTWAPFVDADLRERNEVLQEVCPFQSPPYVR